MKRNLGFRPLFFGVRVNASVLGLGECGERCSLDSGGGILTLSPRLTVLGGKIVGTTARSPSLALGVTTGSGLEYVMPLDKSFLNS